MECGDRDILKTAMSCQGIVASAGVGLKSAV